MKQIGVGLIGFGTVGAGVADGLQRNRKVMAQRLGMDVVLRKIADVDIATDRGVAVDPSVLTTDAMAVIRDPEIQIVVELIGGTGIAKDFVLAALNAGKSVVTANKKLLAEYGEEIFGAAERNGVDIYFGASVGGGIPIIRVLREGLAGNEIQSIHGILNGTCNYILTRMENEGLPFDEVLAAAQKAGYAEANPGLDIDGFDTAHKAIILASLAYGFHVPMEKVAVEGIRNLSGMDVRYAAEFGYRIKLLAVVKRDGDEVEVGVHPTLVPTGHMLASVSNVFNAAMVHGDLSGDTLYYGRGAGREPTASTVIGDSGDMARNPVTVDLYILSVTSDAAYISAVRPTIPDDSTLAMSWETVDLDLSDNGGLPGGVTYLTLSSLHGDLAAAGGLTFNADGTRLYLAVEINTNISGQVPAVYALDLVPGPATMALRGLGFAGIAAVRRKRR